MIYLLGDYYPDQYWNGGYTLLTLQFLSESCYSAYDNNTSTILCPTVSYGCDQLSTVGLIQQYVDDTPVFIRQMETVCALIVPRML